jgi:hypothetical protein
VRRALGGVGEDPAIEQEAAKALPGRAQAPTLRKRFGHHEANVVARVRVLPTGVAQPHDQPVDRAAAAPAKQPSQTRLLLA